MTTWYHEQRLEAAREVVLSNGTKTILDLGCGDGDLLVRLVNEPQIERIVGLDLCDRALCRLRGRLGATASRAAGMVTLIHGSMTEADAALRGFDCAMLIETIEHIDPARLSVLEHAIFRGFRPRTVLITTPNAEFNPLLGVPATRFRHRDHRFEWSRRRFRRWADGVALRAGYEVVCRDIAGWHPELGGASQMAVFEDMSRLDVEAA